MLSRLKETSPTQLLTGLYVSTVAAVSLLLVGGQVLTQRSLARQALDARVVNVAGRQRMLSQKIAKTANAFLIIPAGSHEPSGSVVNTAAARSELRTALDHFRLAHEGLQKGSAELELPNNYNSATVLAMFAEITPDYDGIVTAAESLLTPFQADIGGAVDAVADHEDPFLKEMNAIVARYEAEATERVHRLQKIQRMLLALALLALLPMLVPIYQVTCRVRNMVTAMQASGIQVKSSSFQIAASCRQLEATVSEQAAAGSQITGASREIATTAQSLTAHVSQVLDKAKITMETASTGEEELAALADMMAQLETMTAAITERLGTISDRANTIDRVVIAITKVADQTNLLSLNAAIEAEKAGEYGAGFSVVAREIRRLADQTAMSTLEIEALVKEMQSAVSVGVMEMDKFTQQVSDGTGRTERITQQIMSITQQVRSLLPALSQVNEGMNTQALGAQQIRDALEQFSEGTQQTARSLQESNSALGLLQETAEGLQV
ncbi:MAG: methyl-accepting chemotaxis protein [Cyanobacteria bacterium P01_F01_bin.3]